MLPRMALRCMRGAEGPCFATAVLHEARTDDFDIRNMARRVASVGDLWAALLEPEGRFDFSRLMQTAGSA